MNLIREECIKRGITRLCHFTQSRNLAHILGDREGILSTQSLENRDMPYNPSDPIRIDGRYNRICCSLEYPNTYYFVEARKRDRLFKDWVVLYIEPDYIWASGTSYCPCNAARSDGQYIGEGLDCFLSLFSPAPPGVSFRRKNSHLTSSPTDIQAEVLITEPVTLDSIIGIAVQNEEQAQKEILRLRLQGITLPKPMFIVPGFFDRAKLSGFIQQGERVMEMKYDKGEHHG